MSDFFYIYGKSFQKMARFPKYLVSRKERRRDTE